jgi:hypothetical protein
MEKASTSLIKSVSQVLMWKLDFQGQLKDHVVLSPASQ